MVMPLVLILTSILPRNKQPSRWAQMSSQLQAQSGGEIDSGLFPCVRPSRLDWPSHPDVFLSRPRWSPGSGTSSPAVPPCHPLSWKTITDDAFDASSPVATVSTVFRQSMGQNRGQTDQQLHHGDVHGPECIASLTLTPSLISNNSGNRQLNWRQYGSDFRCRRNVGRFTIILRT